MALRQQGEPQWIVRGREAAGRALYESWRPLRMDNGHPRGSWPWERLTDEERQPFLDAGQAACEAYHRATLEQARDDLAAAGVGPKP